ncbi:MAG: hypothetical protein NWF08_04780 [Candidatus Bathyarchaeota archaeon]|nr:hypothetical protein [Candidatus Bathyarchaeota archaeon]
MKMNTKVRIVLFSILTIILLQFSSTYHIQITHAASSCCGVGACAATGTGATGNGASAGSGFSAGMSFKSNEVEFYNLNQQVLKPIYLENEELLVNSIDRVNSLLTNVPSEDPIIWVIM